VTALTPDPRVGDLSVAFNVGLTTGAFTWGILVDVVGRKWCFNLTCLIASIFGFLFAGEHHASHRDER
jgi:MFS family permease